MKETFGQKTRRSHKRNQRVVMFWCAFVFAFVTFPVKNQYQNLIVPIGNSGSGPLFSLAGTG